MDGVSIHLVNADNQLLDSESVGQQEVLASLSLIGDTGLELSFGGCDDEDSAVCLRSPRDHILDEIPMPRRIDNSNPILRSLKLPQRDINSDPPLPGSLDPIHEPRILECTHIGIIGLFLQFLKHSFLEATTQIDEVSRCGGFSSIDVTDYDDT